MSFSDPLPADAPLGQIAPSRQQKARATLADDAGSKRNACAQSWASRASAPEMSALPGPSSTFSAATTPSLTIIE